MHEALSFGQIKCKVVNEEETRDEGKLENASYIVMLEYWKFFLRESGNLVGSV